MSPLGPALPRAPVEHLLFVRSKGMLHLPFLGDGRQCRGSPTLGSPGNGTEKTSVPRSLKYFLARGYRLARHCDIALWMEGPQRLSRHTKGGSTNITEIRSALGPQTLLGQPGNTRPPVNNMPRRPKRGKAVRQPDNAEAICCWHPG